jgi:hypothetical protein
MSERGTCAKITTLTYGEKQDLVCVIEHSPFDGAIPGKAQTYGEMPVPPEVKKVFPAW